MDFKIASSLTDQSAGRHVAPLGHILISSLILLLDGACFTEKQQIPISWSLVWPKWGSNLQCRTCETATPNHYITDAVTGLWYIAWINHIIDENMSLAWSSWLKLSLPQGKENIEIYTLQRTLVTTRRHTLTCSTEINIR